jgi:MinD-like ATPase involved in chromosome partitioning or flagellar assembly
MKSIIVYSGKGGVGKTTTSANIAKTLAAQGKKVYVIDADINTPSMGVIFGNAHPAENIWIASTSFLYKNMIYMENSMVRKFLRDCTKHINEVQPDYLIVDTPPSITDVHINLLEIIKVSAIVIVTQPNELSRTDVNRTAMFFTEKCKEAGCVVVENMCKDEPPGEYAWPCIERIPFVEGFKGSEAFTLFPEKYKNVVDYLQKMNPADVRFESQKRMLFDESITVDDIPYWSSDSLGLLASGISKSDIKFINIGTWDKIRDRLLDMDCYFGHPDQRLMNLTTEKVSRLVKAFEEDDEAYFMVITAPHTEIDLLPGEIGKASLFIADSYYGIPRIKYQTRQGEVVLFPDEVMPADDREIAIALKEGSTITPEGRYIPSKTSMEEIYNAFGNRTGLGENWETVYDRIVNQQVGGKTLKSVNSIVKNKAEQMKTSRKAYAKKLQVVAIAKIIDGQSSWEEEFKVSSEETAEEEIQKVISKFNNTLKKGERERTLKEILSFK